jgi:uncharacterized protein (TIGR01777 family)
MRVIITGGTGLVGRPLAAGLAEDGHEVIVLSRHPEGAGRLPAGVRAARWDGATAEGWGHLVEGAGAVVNLAGENLSAGRWTAERKARIVASRVNAGQAVVEAVKSAQQRPAVVVQSSAVGYYGPHGDEAVDESSPAGPDYLSRIALQWEASTQEVEGLGVRRAIIRTGVVLSRYGGALPRLLLPFRFFVGGTVGSGRQWFPWIHIVDEVRAIRFLIDRPEARGPFNLSAPNPVTYASLARTLGRVLHRPALVPVPGFALRLLFGEMATVLLEGQREVPAALLRLGFTFRYPELAPALRDLTQEAPRTAGN